VNSEGVKLGYSWKSLGGNFHTDLATLPRTVGVVRWPAAGDTAGSSLRRLSSLQHRIYNLLDQDWYTSSESWRERVPEFKNVLDKNARLTLERLGVQQARLEGHLRPPPDKCLGYRAFDLEAVVRGAVVRGQLSVGRCPGGVLSGGRGPSTARLAIPSKMFKIFKDRRKENRFDTWWQMCDIL